MADLRSAWGGGGRITITGAVTAPSGHKLALNATRDGVIVWYVATFGKACMAVALAANRAATIAWQNARTDIVAMTNHIHLYPFTISVRMTDAQLNEVGFSDRSSALSNTNHMSAAGSPAAAFARSKRIGGVACVLPNIQQMQRIYALKAEIDALDPTVKANPTMSLNSWHFGGVSKYAWTSTEADADHAWYVALNGRVDRGFTKLDRYSVIPILELDPVTLRPL